MIGLLVWQGGLQVKAGHVEKKKIEGKGEVVYVEQYRKVSWLNLPIVEILGLFFTALFFLYFAIWGENKYVMVSGGLFLGGICGWAVALFSVIGQGLLLRIYRDQRKKIVAYRKALWVTFWVDVGAMGLGLFMGFLLSSTAIERGLAKFQIFDHGRLKAPKIRMLYVTIIVGGWGAWASALFRNLRYWALPLKLKKRKNPPS